MEATLQYCPVSKEVQSYALAEKFTFFFNFENLPLSFRFTSKTDPHLLLPFLRKSYIFPKKMGGKCPIGPHPRLICPCHIITRITNPC